MQQNWHRGYLWPVSLALLIHLVFFALLLRPLPVSPPAIVEPVSSYLYTPPKPVVPAEPLLTEVVAAVLPAEPDETNVATQAAPNTRSPIEEEAFSTATGSTEQYEVLSDTLTTEQTSVDADARLVSEHAATSSTAASLAERALSGIAQQYSAPVADYAGWSQQQKQPRLTVAKEHQQLSSEAENAARGVGMQMVKLGDRCLIVDPALSGFEQLMDAKGIPCKESDDAVLFRQVMSKWLDR
ncbi:hypothetical protein GCM10010919_30570 [Alishewanella longhuensis]|uniref:Energy transducer TonB n=1 Tax=Alishewanella longhuensis TaxID=1091037 RepID=A0ABQ3LA79_9ALTE|nr:hypothetical protein [Alishewanella longhuensis]GHG75905.1 hypothetical protein GCM10010919_30570 [Alishewanella longhuensis]